MADKIAHVYTSIGPNTMFVAFVLREKGVWDKIEKKQVDIIAGDNRKPEFLKVGARRFAVCCERRAATCSVIGNISHRCSLSCFCSSDPVATCSVIGNIFPPLLAHLASRSSRLATYFLRCSLTCF